MAKLPRRPDPARLQSLESATTTLEPGTRLHRIYSRGGDYPTSWNAFRSFGPLRSRFDHHLVDEEGDPKAQQCSILYAALDLPSAFAEVFQADRRIDRTRRAPWLASFRPRRAAAAARPVRHLSSAQGRRVDETDDRLRAHGAALVAGFPRDLPGDRRDPLSVVVDRTFVRALYERAEHTFAGSPTLRLHRALGDEALLGAVIVAAGTIGYTIV